MSDFPPHSEKSSATEKRFDADHENCDKSTLNLADIQAIYAKPSDEGDLEVLVYVAKNGFEHVVVGRQTACGIREKQSIEFVCDTIPILQTMDEKEKSRPLLFINGVQTSPKEFFLNAFHNLEYEGKPGEEEEEKDEWEDDKWDDDNGE